MFGGSGAEKRENYVYGSFSCLKPQWRKAEQISHERMVHAAAAMTTKRKGQMFSSEPKALGTESQMQQSMPPPPVNNYILVFRRNVYKWLTCENLLFGESSWAAVSPGSQDCGSLSNAMMFPSGMFFPPSSKLGIWSNRQVPARWGAAPWGVARPVCGLRWAPRNQAAAGTP